MIIRILFELQIWKYRPDEKLIARRLERYSNILSTFFLLIRYDDNLKFYILEGKLRNKIY